MEKSSPHGSLEITTISAPQKYTLNIAAWRATSHYLINRSVALTFISVTVAC
jgi:hypothetical protein